MAAARDADARHAQLDVHARHPWLLDAGGRTAGPGMLAWFDTCLCVLAPVECGTPAKFEAIAMLTGISVLFARAAKAPPTTGFTGADPAAYPWLAAALEQPGEATPDLFDRVLRGLLRSLLD